MAENHKENKEQFNNCCRDMPLAGMMEAMMSRKEELCGCGCMETIKKMVSKSSWPQDQGKKTE